MHPCIVETVKVEKQVEVIYPETSNYKEIGSYQCDICWSNFSQHSDLSRHILTVHKGVRPFQCENCGSNFTQKCKLDEHVAGKSCEIDPYRCDFCWAKFSQHWNLSRYHP